MGKESERSKRDREWATDKKKEREKGVIKRDTDKDKNIKGLGREKEI